MQLIDGLRALANPTRLRILELLKDPSAFDGPRDAAGRPRGVTGKALLRQLKCTQPSLNEHAAILIAVGLIEGVRMGRFVLYRRDEQRIAQLRQVIIDRLQPPQ